MRINSKLSKFPTPEGYTGTKYFSEPKLRRVLLKALPRSYQLKVRTSAKTLDQFTLEELQDFLETCLDEAESKNAEKTNNKNNNKNNKSYDSNSDKKRKKGDEGSNGPSKCKKKFCRICKDAGQTFKRYTSHDASECKFKNKKADENKKLYSLLKKTEKRLKRLKKRKSHSNSDSSNSA